MTKTFRGAVEPIKSGHNWPFTAARLMVSTDELRIRRLIGRNRTLSKDSQVKIQVEKRRSPLEWTTIVTLKFLEGDEERKILFLPFRGQALMHELDAAGWSYWLVS